MCPRVLAGVFQAVCLRGAQQRSAQWTIGLVLNTGADTKVSPPGSGRGAVAVGLSVCSRLPVCRAGSRSACVRAGRGRIACGGVSSGGAELRRSRPQALLGRDRRQPVSARLTFLGVAVLRNYPLPPPRPPTPDPDPRDRGSRLGLPVLLAFVVVSHACIPTFRHTHTYPHPKHQCRVKY